MRIARVAVVGFAGIMAMVACAGDNSPTGAYLQVNNIPSGATEVEILLVGKPTTVHGQHTNEKFDGREDVLYYLQRGSTGGLVPVARRTSLLVEIQPVPGISTTDFAPIVIARANAGDDTTIMAMATLAGSGTPSPMELATTKVAVYEADLAPAAVATSNRIANGEHALFACTASRGLVWRSTEGTEIRVVRPPATSTTLDAKGLPLDLDCDAVAADENDCDDLQSDVHPGAAERCDGIDSDCKNDVEYVDSCTVSPAQATCAIGRALCNEEAPASELCVSAPAPSCSVGSDLAQVCDVSFNTEGPTPTACAPAIGLVTLPHDICTTPPCDVRVAGTTGGWTAGVGATSGGPFDDSGTTTSQGAFVLEVAKTTMPTGMLPPNDIGVIDFIIGDGSAMRYFGVALIAGTDGCTLVGGGMGSGSGGGSGSGATYTMACHPDVRN